MEIEDESFFRHSGKDGVEGFVGDDARGGIGCYACVKLVLCM